MAFIDWNNSYSVGVKIIDGQHQKLFSLINDFYDATTGTSRKNLAPVDSVLLDLLSYVGFHFKTEEKYFEEFGYEKTQEHKNQHEFYENKIKNLNEKYQKKKKEEEISEEIISFIKDWILNHIKISDKEYRKCFNEHGLI